MSLEDLRVYNLAMVLGEKIWDVVAQWDFFQKDTVGKQLVRAADSIAANLSEGYGRYHSKRPKISVITPEVLCLKQKRCLQRRTTESLLKLKALTI